MFVGQSQPGMSLKIRRNRTKFTKLPRVHCRSVRRRKICDRSWCLTIKLAANMLLINEIRRIVRCRESRVTVPDNGSSFGVEKSNKKLCCVIVFSKLYTKCCIKHLNILLNSHTICWHIFHVLKFLLQFFFDVLILFHKSGAII